jgi:hypothetical protein
VNFGKRWRSACLLPDYAIRRTTEVGVLTPELVTLGVSSNRKVTPKRSEVILLKQLRLRRSVQDDGRRGLGIVVI